MTSKIDNYKQGLLAGFTLIETIIYSALIGITITGFISFSLLIVGLKSKADIVEQVNVNARASLGIISSYIKKADQIVTPIPGNSSSTLVLSLAGGTAAIIKKAGGRLILDEDGVITNITNNRATVNNISFKNYGSASVDNIGIDINIGRIYGSSLEFNYDSSFLTSVSVRQ